MPDPVSCHPAQNHPSIIDCDPICIGPEPEPAPAAENRSAQPGVRVLVAGHEAPMRVRTQTTIHVPLEVDVGEIAGRCAGDAAGVVLGVIAASKLPPVLGLLTAAKVGFDLGECVAQTVNEATRRAAEARAVEICTDAGGTPLGTANGALICEAPLEVK
jgi:hypothetical protein